MPKQTQEEENKLEDPLVPVEEYLESGIHIGSKFKTGKMDEFTYKCRDDGLWILDIKKIDQRLKKAINMIAREDTNQILVIAGRSYAQKPAKEMAEKIGAEPIIGRYTPGTLTNPEGKEFREPDLIITADPSIDGQAIEEASKAKVPVISLCDTSNMVPNIDLIVPANNKGKKSLALVYYLIAREVLKEKRIISEDEEFEPEVEDFKTQR